MAFVHGKNTVITLGGTDLSAFTNTSSFTRGAKVHDVTTYGKSDEVYGAGLGSNSFSMGGVYDDGATGPRDIIEPLVGVASTLIRKPEGSGTGKPQDSVTVICTSYVETSPTNDYVAWSAEFQCSDAVTSTNQ